MRRVLSDLTGFAKLNIVEGKTGGKLIAEGKIGQCDVPTANGRVYPRSIMEREVSRLQPRIEQASVISAVDHPGDGKTRIRESGAIMRGLWIEPSGEIHGRFEVVEEAPAGQALAAFLRRGAQIGMSSRGMGSTIPGPKGQDIVGEDYHLSTWDFVSDPACKDAYPAIMSEDKEATVTEDHLRARFPDLVRAIEEKAHQVAQELVESDANTRVRAEVEKEAETALKKGREALRESVKAEVYDEVFAQLREDFATKLVRTIAEMRDEITEEVKSNLASDPAVAGAKGTLKKIAEMVHPFLPTPEQRTALQERGKESNDLQKEIARLANALSEQEARTGSLEAQGRLLAYRLYVEQSIGHRPDADTIRSMIGEVTEKQSVNDLKAKVEAAIAKADAVQEAAQEEVESLRTKTEEEIETAKAEAAAEVARVRAEAEKAVSTAEAKVTLAAKSEERIEAIVRERTAALEEQIQKVLGEKEQEIAELREQVKVTAKAAKVAEKAVAEAENDAQLRQLTTYAYRRTVGHPHAKEIVEAVADGKISSKAEIDKIASKLEEQAQEPGGVQERVRRAMSSGREHMTEDQRRAHDADESAVSGESGEAAADLREIGTSLTEQINLAGVRPQRR